MAVGSCCYGISRMFCEQKKKKTEFAPAGGGVSRSKLRRNGSLLLLASANQKARSPDVGLSFLAQWAALTVEAPADAAEPRLEPAPEGVDEAELNVQAAAAADPAAAELPAGPRVTATAPAAAPPTATNALAAFAVLL